MKETKAEQKPAEYEKPLLERFKQAVYDCAWGKVTCKVEGESKQEYANRWAEHFLLMVREWADDYIDSREDVTRRRAYDEGKNCHKPAEWGEEDKYYHGIIMYLLNNECVGAKDKENAINWFKDLKDRVLPQHKQEWSEEDEKMLDTVIEDIIRLAGPKVCYHKDVDWLKSLKERVGCEVDCTTKQEWTQTDMNLMDAAIAFVQQNKSFNCWGGVNKEGVIAFLQSLRPQNPWKPTEDQMDAVNLASKLLKGNAYLIGDKEVSNVLKNIHEQLKKL